MAYPEPIFNNSYGHGAEGFFNYTNSLVDGWFANLFIAMIFIAGTFVFSKSEWKMPSICAFMFLVCGVTAIIFKQFTAVNEYLVFLCGIGLAVSLFVAWITK